MAGELAGSIPEEFGKHEGRSKSTRKVIRRLPQKAIRNMGQ